MLVKCYWKVKKREKSQLAERVSGGLSEQKHGGEIEIYFDKKWREIRERERKKKEKSELGC